MPIGTPSVPYRLPGSQYERWVDIYTRLGVERILFLGQEVNDGIANSLVAQMLYLDSDDNTKPIYLYINSPGGSVTAGLAIYDTIKYVKSDVVTICVGLAASMGAFLLGAGTKGKRVALPHSRIMIHQPLGGTSQRQASDIEIEAREILRIKDMLNHSMSDMTGQSFEKIEKDTDRDYFLSAEEAKNYGLIDRVISPFNMLILSCLLYGLRLYLWATVFMNPPYQVLLLATFDIINATLSWIATMKFAFKISPHDCFAMVVGIMSAVQSTFNEPFKT